MVGGGGAVVVVVGRGARVVVVVGRGARVVVVVGRGARVVVVVGARWSWSPLRWWSLPWWWWSALVVVDPLVVAVVDDPPAAGLPGRASRPSTPCTVRLADARGRGRRGRAAAEDELGAWRLEGWPPSSRAPIRCHGEPWWSDRWTGPGLGRGGVWALVATPAIDATTTVTPRTTATTSAERSLVEPASRRKTGRARTPLACVPARRLGEPSERGLLRHAQAGPQGMADRGEGTQHGDGLVGQVLAWARGPGPASR